MVTPIDVLLLHPNASGQLYQTLATKIATIEPPLWILMLSQSIKKHGYISKWIDCIAENKNHTDILEDIKTLHPRLVVIAVYGQHPSASTPAMYGASLLCNHIKNSLHEQKIVLIGLHVSALPQMTILEEHADFVAQGEGLYTILGLLQTDMKTHNQLDKVPGLWYLKNNLPIFTFRASNIPQHSLENELPGLDIDSLNIHQYRAPNWFCFDPKYNRDTYISIYTSLGCPNQCDFCCINTLFGGHSFRYWPVEFTIQQFEKFYDMGIRNIKIADELFISYEEHFLKLCELLIERKYNFNIWAFSAIDTIKKQHLPILKKAGVHWLAIGIEHFNINIRKGMHKARFTEEDVFKTVKEIQQAGIYVQGNYVFGFPDDDLQSMQYNLDMAIALNCESVNFYCMMAYPGSTLYNLARTNHWQLPENWLGYSQYAYETLPLATKYLNGPEVLTFRDQAWKIYHQNPKYLQSIQNTFTEDAMFYIDKIAQLSLPRKYILKEQLAQYHSL